MWYCNGRMRFFALSCIFFAVGGGGARIDTGTTTGFLGICTGLASTAASSLASVRALVNSVFRSSIAFTVATLLAFFAEIFTGESFGANCFAMISRLVVKMLAVN